MRCVNPERMFRGRLFAWAAVVLAPAAAAHAAQGRLVLPMVTGQPEVAVFAGHPGWIDICARGYGVGVSARIGDDGSFSIPEQKQRVCLIATLDGFEAPPIVLPQWPVKEGDYDVPIAAEYVCLPPGWPEPDAKALDEAHNFYQTFVPRGSQLYGVSFFDGPKIQDWGNQVTVMLHKDQPGKYPIPLKDQVSPDPGWEGILDRMTTQKGRDAILRMGWRHGDMPVEPGQKYVLQVEGHRSHSGKHYKTGAYLRPDGGNAYPDGQAMVNDKPVDADLSCIIFSNANGQLVENHVRSEEWELFIPRHRPSTSWGQAFVAHGRSLAGISFWASGGEQKGMQCEIRVREEGPWGKLIKPVKVARGHESPIRPVVRYPDLPAPLPEYEAYYRPPSLLFQVAYLPGELPLEPGKTYYVEIVPTKPLMLYVDGDFYQSGYAYYEGLKVDRQSAGHVTMHSKRWTLAMSIVTYAGDDDRK